MTLKRAILSVFLACGFSAAQTPIKIFLLAGQSNMTGYTVSTGLASNLVAAQPNVIIHIDGEVAAAKKKKWVNDSAGLGQDATKFGPEVTFGKTMTDSLPGVKFGLIKYSWGGTALADRWRPPSSGGTVGDLYTNFVNEIDTALASLGPQYAPKIVGMLWMQGEFDALDQTMANAYETNLTNFIKDVRTKVGIPDMPVILAKIDSQTLWTYNVTVRAAYTKVANAGTNIRVFDTKGYPTDGVHYQVNGMISLGQNFAKTYLASFKGSVSPTRLARENEKIGVGNIGLYASGKNLFLNLPSGSLEKVLKVDILDVNGRRIFARELRTTGGRIGLDLSAIHSSGLHIVRIRFGESSWQQPVLIP